MPAVGATVCLTVPQAKVVRDSLNALPLVRKEARSWHQAATRYKLAADTAHSAYVAQVSAGLNLALALREQKIETTRQAVKARTWQAKAQRRSFWNWLAAAAVAGLTIGFVTR